MATSIGEPEGLQGLRDEMREALVFDYDGVLADTEFLHWKSWELCFLNMSFLARTSNASAWFASGHLRRFRSHKKRSLLTTLGAYRLGLVTSSERSKVEPILRASAIYEKFDAMVFGEDVTAHQPAPDPYLLVAQKLGVRESCSRTRNLDLRAPPLRGSKLSESRNRRILQKLSYCLCAVKRILQRLSGPEFSRSHASLLLPQITSYRKAFSISP